MKFTIGALGVNLIKVITWQILKCNTPFPIATRHTLQWLKAELFSWESCHTSITTRHTVIKTNIFSWKSCLCAKSCKQCIVWDYYLTLAYYEHLQPVVLAKTKTVQ